MLSDVSTGIEVVAENASASLQSCAEQIQRQFGTNAVKNAVHVSKDAASKRADMDILFDCDIKTSAIFNNFTCVDIKPQIKNPAQKTLLPQVRGI